MGALLVIGGVAVDPLSQQLVHFKDKLKPDPSGNASLPFATNWTASGQSTNAHGKSQAQTIRLIKLCTHIRTDMRLIMQSGRI